MVLLDAFSTKDSQMIRAVKVLHPLVVLFAEEALDAVLVLEIQISKYAVPLHYLVQDIEIERQFIDTLDLLDEFPADRAPHPEVMMQYLQTLGAKSVPAVNQNAWNALADVERLAAVVAVIKSPGSIVSLNDRLGQPVLFCLFQLSLMLHSYFPK